jgi:hypothetical protein
MRLAIHLRLLLHKRGTVSFVHMGRTHDQEHYHTAVVLLTVIPVPILCAHGELEEQASGTDIRIGTPARVCAGNQVFGERLRDYSPFSSSSERLRLLPGGTLSSSGQLRLLPGGRSRDGTMYIFLH